MEKIHALIIDDDKDTANLFKTLLGMVGFECEAVYAAKAALNYLASNEPDIVLLDMRLGLEIDGADILYQIRSNPRFEKMRVIVVTGYPEMVEPVTNLADLVLLKPLEFENLETFATRLTQVRPKTSLFRDPVSNLFSLSFFMTRLEHAFERSKRRPELIYATLAIRFEIVLDGGKQPEKSERQLILRQIGERLNKEFRITDTFGYLGGEQVVGLCEDLKKADDIFVIIQRLRGNFSKQFEVDERRLQVNPVIGAVLNHPHFQKADEILEAAVQAMDQAGDHQDRYLVLGVQAGVGN